MPHGASLSLSRWVEARDEDHAVEQVRLCIDRDLETILGGVNTINVSDVLLDFDEIREIDRPEEEPWNGDPFFEEDTPMPRHVVVRRRPERRQGDA